MYRSYPIATQKPRERFPYFESIVDTVFGPMQLDLNRDARETFIARMEAVDLSRARLLRVSASTVTVRRRERDVARGADFPYLIKFQLKGESRWSQRQRQVSLQVGDFVIGSTAEPYTLSSAGEHEMAVLAVSPPTMRQLVADPDQFLGVRMRGADPDCGLLSSFIRQATIRMEALSEPMARRVEGVVMDLLGGVLLARTRRASVSRSHQLTKIKQYIADHLHDRRLTPTSVADVFGVSTRQIHAIFAAEDMTLARYIRSLRVNGCRRAIENSSSSSQSLTDLALSWGFYDLSHMTRCFREEFGVSPGQFFASVRQLS